MIGGPAPEGQEFVDDGPDGRHVPVIVTVHLDGGGRQAARDGVRVQEDAPFLRTDLQVLQGGEFGDLQRIGERTGDRRRGSSAGTVRRPGRG